ncbi:transcription initiation factor IIB [Thermococci archaeon]|nr:MAG: transcription initiation factor IIB [Thermococci archaeon]
MYEDKCPECGSKELVTDHERGEVICSKCGFVVTDKIIDQGPEWRAFDDEQREKRARTGAPTSLGIHDYGLTTTIGPENKDIGGKDLDPIQKAKMSRLRKWQNRLRVQDSTERNLVIAFSELEKIASNLGIPENVREEASYIYRRAVKKRLIRGRSIESVVAAALYAACRVHKISRTLDEIAEASNVKKKDIGKSYRYIARELNLKLPPPPPSDYIPRFSSKLGLSARTQSLALRLLKIASERGLISGRGPTGVAAAAIYIASAIGDEKKTQRDVAEVAKVTEVTVRNRYKELVERLFEEIMEMAKEERVDPEELALRLNISLDFVKNNGVMGQYNSRESP